MKKFDDTRITVERNDVSRYYESRLIVEVSRGVLRGVSRGVSSSGVVRGVSTRFSPGLWSLEDVADIQNVES